MVFGPCLAPQPNAPNHAGGAAVRAKQLVVVMEKVDGGELFDEVMAVHGMDEGTAKVLFRQILLAMAYCHARQVAHRDMKLENLLLTADKRTVKVCDFGLAKNVTESATSTIIGTVGMHDTQPCRRTAASVTPAPRVVSQADSQSACCAWGRCRASTLPQRYSEAILLGTTASRCDSSRPSLITRASMKP
jgi:serine/threonine protein kinase